MTRFVSSAFFALALASPLLGQQREKPVLYVSCIADKVNVTSGDSVSLTVSLENHGSSDVYVYRTLEWGWAGIGFTLTNNKGDVVHAKKYVTPLPPPPIYDKSQLVGLSPGYFFGTHMFFDLSAYALSPGVYFIQVSYQSNYPKEEGFGLPILTFDDGEFRSDKIQIQVSQKPEGQ
jgi:hypothetical protein